MAVRKRFDRDLYEKYDTLAKEAVEKLIDKRKFRVEENPKKRGVDLQVYRRKDDELLFNIETEVKRVWKTKDFKYDSVQFPERKAKFCVLEKPTVFIMFNEDQSSYLAVRDKDLLKSPCVEVPNRYCYKGEYFYQVPLKKVKFNDVKSIIGKIVK